MKERRKIFSAADLAAIRDGRKTMFREMVGKQPPSEIEYPPEGRDGWFCSGVLGAKDYGHGLEWTVGASWGSQPCPQRWLHLLPKLAPPLGTIGDRLWLPEAWMVGRKQNKELAFGWVAGHVWSKDRIVRCPRNWSERDLPSITMPRWACRTFAEITGVRVERVADITEEDAKAEGVVESEIGRLASRTLANYKAIHRAPLVLQFADLWQSRYANWEANPWVWVYSIKLIKL